MQNTKTKYGESLIILRELVRVDFKLRYQGSVLGYAWSLLRPLMMFLTLYIVFTKFLRVGDSVEFFPVYLLTGIVFWNFFSEMTSISIGSVVERAGIIRKLHFPKIVIPLSTMASAVINLGFNLIVLFVVMVFTGVPFRLSAILIIFPVIQLTMLSLGVSFFLSALFVRYRDLKYIWEVTLQAAFYATPILYPLAIINSALGQKVVMLNPVAQIVQQIRRLMVTDQSETVNDVFGVPYASIIGVFFCVAVLAAGIAYFRSKSKYFAEDV